MPQPPAYNRSKNFTANFGSETDHSALNAELDNLANSVNTIRTNIALMQADDGKILQGAITTDSIGQDVIDGLIDEVSNGITTYRDQAATSAGEAATSASNAASSAANAQGSASAAATSATSAANSAASVQTYIDHVARTDNPHGTTKAHVGLSNVDNTSDADKPVSAATQAALNAKANPSDIGMRLLHASDNSNVAAIDITSVFTSDYDEYQIELYDIIARTSGVNLSGRVSTDNGASYLSSTIYNHSRLTPTSTASAGSLATGDTSYMIASSVNSIIGGAFTLKLRTGGAAVNVRTRLYWNGGVYNATNEERAFIGSAAISADNVNAVRFYMSSGNIDAKVRVYGLRKE